MGRAMMGMSMGGGVASISMKDMMPVSYLVAQVGA
jgi:hypothetical protein